ncbi:MAG: hypothetical protein R3F25_12075 [Gammaproteobacteria bacterium]
MITIDGIGEITFFVNIGISGDISSFSFFLFATSGQVTSYAGINPFIENLVLV